MLVDNCKSCLLREFSGQLCHAGAAMEINISHRIRQEILATTDLTHPDLFTNALNELMQLMKMVGYLFTNT